MTNKYIITIVILVVIVASILDVSYAKTFEIIFKTYNNNWNILIFITVSFACIICQYYILKYIKEKTKSIYKNNNINIFKLNLYKLVTVSQYFLILIILIVNIQIIALSKYSTSLLVASSTTSYVISIGITALLAYKFFFWFKSDKNLIVFSYGLAAVAFIINLCMTLILTELILLGKPLQLGPHFGTAGYSPIQGSIMEVINNLYLLTSIASFLMLWISTVMFLFHYRNQGNTDKKRKITKYWIISVIPLTYFLSQFAFVFDIFSSFNGIPITISILLTLIFLLGKPVGGILFGMVFFLLRKGLPKKNPVNDYLRISSFGILILFIANQGIALSNALYPPYGLTTVSFLGLASYMFLIGLYSSAISSAQDNNLRKTIKNSTIDQSKLLSTLSHAELERQLEDKVSTIATNKRTTWENQTGIYSSLADDDIKQYVLFIMEELNKKNSLKDNAENRGDSIQND
jgi:hypothetical protein